MLIRAAPPAAIFMTLLIASISGCIGSPSAGNANGEMTGFEAVFQDIDQGLIVRISFGGDTAAIVDASGHRTVNAAPITYEFDGETGPVSVTRAWVDEDWRVIRIDHACPPDGSGCRWALDWRLQGGPAPYGVAWGKAGVLDSVDWIGWTNVTLPFRIVHGERAVHVSIDDPAKWPRGLQVANPTTLAYQEGRLVPDHFDAPWMNLTLVAYSATAAPAVSDRLQRDAVEKGRISDWNLFPGETTSFPGMNDSADEAFAILERDAPAAAARFLDCPVSYLAQPVGAEAYHESTGTQIQTTQRHSFALVGPSGLEVWRVERDKTLGVVDSDYRTYRQNDSFPIGVDVCQQFKQLDAAWDTHTALAFLQSFGAKASGDVSSYSVIALDDEEDRIFGENNRVVFAISFRQVGSQVAFQQSSQISVLLGSGNLVTAYLVQDDARRFGGVGDPDTYPM